MMKTVMKITIGTVAIEMDEAGEEGGADEVVTSTTTRKERTQIRRSTCRKIDRMKRS